MRLATISAALAAALFSTQVSAQQPAAPAAPAAPASGAAPSASGLPAGVPEKMPNDIPYGEPISMDLAKKAVEAAVAESAKRQWKMAVAVVSPAGDLIYFARMDDTQWSSSGIAHGKARASARLRRESKVFFDLMETGHPYVAALSPDVVASPGGIPIVIAGKLIGAIGCSGAAGSQDAVACQAGVNALGK
jgi:glc operon protein GlcG